MRAAAGSIVLVIAAVATRAGAAPAGPLQPVVDPLRDDAECALWLSELDAAAPPVIPLATYDGGPLPDNCPDEVAAMVAGRACAPCADRDPALADLRCNTTCESATLRGGVRVRLALDGPNGSGHFEWLGVVVGNRFACIAASTVGVRALDGLPASFGALPWLADLDGDGDAELIAWQRLPWGQGEVENALAPIAYAFDGARLVRRDDRARALRRRVAALYAAHKGERCFASVARALGS